MAITKFSIYSPNSGIRQDYPNILLANSFTPDNRNIQVWDGELRTAKMRRPEMLRNVHEITDVSGTSITISGDYTGVIASGDSIVVYDVLNNYKQVTVTGSSEVSGDTIITVSEAVPDNVFLVGQWKMNDTSGTSIVDSSVNANNLTSDRDTSLMTTTGKIGAALSFNGTSDALIASSELISASGDFTLCGWIKNAGSSYKFSSAFGNGGWSGTAVKGVVVRKHLTNLVVVMGDGTSNNSYTIISNYDDNDEWNHILISYDASETKLYIYLNGSFLSSHTRTYLYSGSDFEIGHQTGLNAAESYWYGDIDDVRLYDKMLTNTEIAEIYNAGAGTETISTYTEYLFKTDDVVSTDPISEDFLKVQTPDTYPIMRYERIVMSDAAATERLIGFTKAHVYYWNAAETIWEEIFACSSDCDYWDATQYGDWLCATNNVDKPIKWDCDSASTCTYIDTQISDSTSDYITKAKFIKSFRNYLFLGNVTLSDGNAYQHYIYWSAVAQGISDEGFNPNATFDDVASDAGSAWVDGDGEISGGFAIWQSYLVIFKRWSTRKLWATLTDLTFAQDYLLPATGCVAPGSVINDREDKLYFYASDKHIHEITLGRLSYAVSGIVRDINPTYYDKIRAAFIDEYNEIWWAVPYGNAATENNKVLVLSQDKWLVRDMAIYAFGKYSRQVSYKWDTLPYPSWDKWAWDSWDATDANEDFLVDLCSDNAGCSYEAHGAYTDDGDAYTSYFVLTTDFANKSALAYFKRLLRIYLYFRREPLSSVFVYVKRDNELKWQDLGSVNLAGDYDIIRKELVCDVRSKHFLFKIGSSDRFSFVGAEFDFIQQGER